MKKNTLRNFLSTESGYDRKLIRSKSFPENVSIELDIADKKARNTLQTN